MSDKKLTVPEVVHIYHHFPKFSIRHNGYDGWEVIPEKHKEANNETSRPSQDD